MCVLETDKLKNWRWSGSQKIQDNPSVRNPSHGLSPNSENVEGYSKQQKSQKWVFFDRGSTVHFLSEDLPC